MKGHNLRDLNRRFFFGVERLLIETIWRAVRLSRLSLNCLRFKTLQNSACHNPVRSGSTFVAKHLQASRLTEIANYSPLQSPYLFGRSRTLNLSSTLSLLWSWGGHNGESHWPARLTYELHYYELHTTKSVRESSESIRLIIERPYLKQRSNGK